MRLRTAVLSLAAGVALVLTACGNGPPPESQSGSASGGGSSGGGGGGALSPVTSGTAAQKVNETDSLQFSPADVNVKVGDIVQWTNTGSATHNVSFDEGTKSDDMNGNDTYMVKFTKAGDYHYVCTYHAPGMAGTVHVS